MKKKFRRHYYTTKSIIEIIIDERLNDNLRLIRLREFNSKQKYIISLYKSELEENEIIKLTASINNKDISDYEEQYSSDLLNEESLEVSDNYSESEKNKI